MGWTVYHRECGETDRDHFLPQFWPDIRLTSVGNVIES
jgi:hypothetical protein